MFILLIIVVILVLQFAFKKMSKKNDYIRIDDIADTFRHAGQNPSDDVVKALTDKAKRLQKTQHKNDRDSQR
jgi:hypothetical protein